MTDASPTGHNRKADIPHGWFGPALRIVLCLLALRLVALALTKAQLFVDESQYWLWGQELSLGYYSKPPLIGWVIRLTTAIGGDSDFWVRIAAPVFHAVTAMILGAVAAVRFGRRAAVWVAASYMTLPFVALGSILISTDTILAPFYAAALFFWLRHLDLGDLKDAVFAGVMIGCAMMAKYAGAYFLIGAVLAALVDVRFRTSWRGWIALVLAALLVLSPNLIWNAANSFVTFRHTADNVGWVEKAHWFSSLNPAGMAEFLGAQFGVFGPVLFGTLVFLLFSRHRRGRMGWLALILPPLMAVTVQAFLSRAYANWALTAYFPATVLVTAWLLAAAPRLLKLSVLVNAVICVALPVLSALPSLTLNDAPILSRYLGREEASAKILSAAHEQGVSAVVTSERDLLADLFYRVATAGPDVPQIYARPHHGRPESYYDLRHTMPADQTGNVLFIGRIAPKCYGVKPDPFDMIDNKQGAYAGQGLRLFILKAECLNAGS